MLKTDVILNFIFAMYLILAKPLQSRYSEQGADAKTFLTLFIFGKQKFFSSELFYLKFFKECFKNIFK